MFKLLLLSFIQSVLMCSSQSFFKVAASRMGPFSWTWAFFRDSVFTNWWLLAAGICGIVGVYPLSSMSYLLGMFVAIIFFKETVVWQQWVGVFLILAGCGLIAR